VRAPAHVIGIERRGERTAVDEQHQRILLVLVEVRRQGQPAMDVTALARFEPELANGGRSSSATRSLLNSVRLRCSPVAGSTRTTSAGTAELSHTATSASAPACTPEYTPALSASSTSTSPPSAGIVYRRMRPWSMALRYSRSPSGIEIEFPDRAIEIPRQHIKLTVDARTIPIAAGDLAVVVGPFGDRRIAAVKPVAVRRELRAGATEVISTHNPLGLAAIGHRHTR
jgi:hypothetical protein